MKRFVLFFILLQPILVLSQEEKINSDGSSNIPPFYFIKSEPEEEEEIEARQAHFMEQRIYPDTSAQSFDSEILFKEYAKFKSQKVVANKERTSSWEYIGPFQVPSGDGGAGRVNCIRFNPLDSNIIYLGAACGGIWRSRNGGTDWTPLSDFLPTISVSDIVVDPTDTSVIYVATGDKFGFFGITRGQYSAGVLKSTDGGITWNTTGLNYAVTNTTILHKLVINPLDHNRLLCASNNGVFETLDGGVNWTMVLAGICYDLEFKINNPLTVFASGHNDVNISNDGGSSWVAAFPALCPGGRNSIATTPADSNYIYCWCEGGNLFQSVDGGGSFNLVAGSPNATVYPYGYYDQVLEVSPTDKNTLLAGGFTVGKSVDGGVTWSSNASWWPYTDPAYVFADIKDIQFLGGNGSTYFASNDGGLSKTVDGGLSWTSLSDKLFIKQYYGFGNSSLNDSLIYAGAQDTGLDKIFGNVSENKIIGDGVDCLVDYSDDSTFYLCLGGGGIIGVKNGIYNFIYPSVGANWVTPFLLDPDCPYTIFAGYSDIFRSYDRGDSWTNLTNGLTSGNYYSSITIAPSNSNHIYASTYNQLFLTQDGGLSWNSIVSSLPVSAAAITKVETSDLDPNKVWVTFSGYSAGNKVFYSSDAGQNWINYSGTLPNLPVNCMVHQDKSSDMVYIGTEIGVFYRDSTMSDWLVYNTGLPNTIVTDLEIHYKKQKLRAATAGRGIWETGLLNYNNISNDAGVLAINSPYLKNCNTSNPRIKVKNFGSNPITNLTVKYWVDSGTPSYYNFNCSLSPSEDTSVVLPFISFPLGNFTFYASTLLPNGVNDVYDPNDGKYSVAVLDSIGQLQTIVEGFESISSFPPANWDRENNVQLWTAVNVGAYGASAGSVKARLFSYIGNGKYDYLVLPSLDLRNSSGPDYLVFDVAYCQWGYPYEDTLRISVTSDCDTASALYTTVYEKHGSALATAPDSQAAELVPTASEWRTDTVDLSAFTGSHFLKIRIGAFSGTFGNSMYIDNINLITNPIPLSIAEKHERGIQVFPNPVFNQLNITGIKANDVIELYDVFGSLLLKRISSGHRETISGLENIADGVYVVKVVDSAGVFCKKVIKHK